MKNIVIDASMAIQENAILATNDRKLAFAALTANIKLRTVLEKI